MTVNYDETRAAFYGTPETDTHQPDRRDLIALHLKQGLARFSTLADFAADTTAVYSSPTSTQVAVTAGDILGAGRFSAGSRGIDGDGSSRGKLSNDARESV